MFRSASRAVFVLLIAWIITIVVIISGQPADGESTPDRLAGAYGRAVADQDRDEVHRLAPTATDEALDLLLDPPECGTRTPGVSAGGNRLTLSTGGTTCGSLAIKEGDGRWVIDAWADPFGAG